MHTKDQSLAIFFPSHVLNVGSANEGIHERVSGDALYINIRRERDTS